MKNALRLIPLMLLTLVMAPLDAGAKDAAVKEEAKQPPASVMKIISSHKELSKFADLINEAGLEKMFDSKDDTFTVFAPTNDAFGKAPSDVMKKIKSDKDSLQKFVKYHVISGSMVFMSNIRGRRAGPGSASGESLTFDGVGKTTKVNDAEFVTPDLAAANGVVHIMNAVLVPPSFKEKPATAEPRMPKMPELPGTAAPAPGKAPAAPAEAPKAPQAPAATEPLATPSTLATPPAPVAPAPGAQAQQPESGAKKTMGDWMKKLGW